MTSKPAIGVHTDEFEAVLNGNYDSGAATAERLRIAPRTPGAANRAIPRPRLQSYDVPGIAVTLTAIWDVNPSQQFVGTYVSAGVRHGFLQNPGASAPVNIDVDYHGAANTVTYGIKSRRRHRGPVHVRWPSPWLCSRAAKHQLESRNHCAGAADIIGRISPA